MAATGDAGRYGRRMDRGEAAIHAARVSAAPVTTSAHLGDLCDLCVDLLRLGHSQRKTFADKAVHTTNVTTSAATSNPCADHGSPFQIPSSSDTA
jgi:hypothetical protein